MAKILIVDDDDQTMALFENMIKLNGHKPISVSRSRLAIQRAREEIPDLVLLDIMMPEVNGIELCKMFKSDSDLQHIPVIMVSALSDEGSKRDSFHAGAKDFLTKPLLAGDFAKKLRSVLGQDGGFP